MTTKQMNALNYFASGMSQSEAGRKAGFASTCAAQSVSRLLKRPEAQQYLATIKEKSDSPLILDIKARKEFLSGVVNNQLATFTEKMGAIHLLNKMESVYVTKIESDVKVSGGIMVVPMAAADDWEKLAGAGQAALMADAILVD